MEKMGVMITLMVIAVATMAHGGYGYAVRDTDGRFVKPSGQYYVVDQAAHEEYSEDIVVSYASRSLDRPCPRVAVVPNSHINPLPHVPVSFSLESGLSYIRESKPLSISFVVNDEWPCYNQKTQAWTVSSRSTVTTYSEITFGGKLNTKFTNFTIESQGDGYKFVHVDSETGNRSVVGVQSVQPSGFKRLILLDETKPPLVVVFKDAHKLFKRSSLLTMVPFYNSFK